MTRLIRLTVTKIPAPRTTRTKHANPCPHPRAQRENSAHGQGATRSN